MAAYYNENDPEKAYCLKQFIRDGLIAPGDVDSRSIKDVRGDDVKSYTQCHFFAGGGFWSYAFRLAGWEDSRAVWSGSCPCPSFSAAGKGGGFKDARHLWPDWFRLIRECRPATIFGEQVDRAIGYGWLDLVQSDMEGEDYALGSAVLGACSVGAPQRRQRLWWVGVESALGESEIGGGGAFDGESREGDEWEKQIRGSGFLNELGTTSLPRLARRQSESGDDGPQQQTVERTSRDADFLRARPGPVNGFWASADWLRCTDGKFRAVRPGTQPLANGSPRRVLRLRMYGDGIVPEVAAAFIKAYAG